MNTVVEHVLACQCRLGEGPIWHPIEQVLYWVDILEGRLHRFDPHSGDHQVFDVGVIVGSMGLRAGGGFVMATGRGFAFWNPETAQMEFIGDPDPSEGTDARFNDGKTDPQGRFWAGKMSGKPENSLFRLDPDRSIHRMERGISVSNGLGWSPDLQIFYYTDSDARLIYAYDYDPGTGNISNRRDFTRIPQGEGVPDGLAVDLQGYLWSARWGGWKVVRYSPDGQIDCEIPMPVEFPTSCAFGGENLDELYITSAWVEVQPGGRDQQPWAGDVFRLKPQVKGLPEPFFAG